MAAAESQVRAAANDWNNTGIVNIRVYDPFLAGPASTSIIATVDDFVPPTVGSFNHNSGVITVCVHTWYNPDHATLPGTSLSTRDFILRHEIGHLLGLAHPFSHTYGNPACTEYAIMQYAPLWSDRVTAHDRGTLAMRFNLN